MSRHVGVYPEFDDFGADPLAASGFETEVPDLAVPISDPIIVSAGKQEDGHEQ